MKQTIKIISWNVNGLRTRIINSKDASSFKLTTQIEPNSSLDLLLKEFEADIICFSETRCSFETAKKFQIPQYHKYWSSSKGEKARTGDRYSGVAIWTKIKPNSVIDSLPTLKNPDKEGRILTLYYDKFVLVHTYQPNSGTNYQYRTQEWDPAMLEYLEILNKECQCPIIFTGDLNVAHTPYDLHIGDASYQFRNHKNINKPGWLEQQTIKYHQSPKMLGTSKNTSAGFTYRERHAFQTLLESGYIDVYRHLNPETKFKGYTWWDMRKKPYRTLNKGWRIDYFLLNKQYAKIIKDIQVFKHIGEQGSKVSSDHAPLGFTINI